jgi:hypothetical protein
MQTASWQLAVLSLQSLESSTTNFITVHEQTIIFNTTIYVLTMYFYFVFMWKANFMDVPITRYENISFSSPLIG